MAYQYKSRPFYISGGTRDAEWAVYEIEHRRDGYGVWQTSRRHIGNTRAPSERKAVQNVCRRLGKDARGYETSGYWTEYTAERCEAQ